MYIVLYGCKLLERDRNSNFLSIWNISTWKCFICVVYFVGFSFVRFILQLSLFYWNLFHFLRKILRILIHRPFTALVQFSPSCFNIFHQHSPSPSNGFSVNVQFHSAIPIAATCKTWHLRRCRHYRDKPTTTNTTTTISNTAILNI